MTDYGRSATLVRPRRPRSGFAMVPNSWAMDPSLEFEDRGVLTWLLARPPGPVDERVVIAETGAGRDRIRAILRRLVAAGYLVRERIRDAAGRLRKGVRWILRDPHTLMADEVTKDGKPVTGSDLPKHDVSAGHTKDGSSVPGDSLSSTQDDKDVKPRAARTRTTREAAPVKPPRRDPRQPELTGMKRARMAARQTPEPTPEQRQAAAASTAAIHNETASIITAWTAWCAMNGGQPIPAVVRQVEIVVASLVADGVTTTTIKHGLADWTATGLPASVLVSCVNAAATGNRPMSRSARDRKLRDQETQAVIERARQRDEQDARPVNEAIALFGRAQLGIDGAVAVGQ